MQNLIIRITQENTKIIDDDKIGCFILPDTTSDAFAVKFVEAAAQKGKLVLTCGNNALSAYQKWHTDGLIIDTSKEEKPQKSVKQVQAQAKKAIIGVVTRNRRHEAMLVSECEPDFVIFRLWKDGLAENRELIEWYSELFLIQCAAQPEEPCDYTDLPVDFIISDDTYYRV
ncbi:MAG: hypothetical protein VZR95_04840 [Alphaproteobacteria bacterium]